MDILYFGSDGMIRALGDTNFFSHYNHNHDKLGRFAVSKGAARKIDRLQRKIDKRQQKIVKLNAKIQSDRNRKRMAKGAKYDAQLSKATNKARKSSMKKAAGKKLSEKDQKRLMKVEKLKAKSAGETYKNDKWAAKVADLQYKNAKSQNKINKIMEKFGSTGVVEMRSSSRISEGAEFVKKQVNHAVQNPGNIAIDMAVTADTLLKEKSIKKASKKVESDNALGNDDTYNRLLKEYEEVSNKNKESDRLNDLNYINATDWYSSALKKREEELRKKKNK